MYAQAFGLPPLLITNFIGQLAQEMRYNLQAIERLYPRAPERWRGESEISLTDEQRRLFVKLIAPVRLSNVPGEIHGAVMSLLNTKWAMDMSGDWNRVHWDSSQPHPMFGKLVAHGMNGVSQVLAATRQIIDGLRLVPRQAEIVFLKPTFLEEDRLMLNFIAKTPTEYEFTVHAFAGDAEARKVTTVYLTLQEGTWSEEEWFRAHMMLWRISATLAETWPGCLYAKQGITFKRPLEGNNLMTLVRGTGRNARGHCTVNTQVHSPGYPLLPSIMGQATIVLPQTVAA